MADLAVPARTVLALHSGFCRCSLYLSEGCFAADWHECKLSKLSKTGADIHVLQRQTPVDLTPLSVSTDLSIAMHAAGRNVRSI